MVVSNYQLQVAVSLDRVTLGIFLYVRYMELFGMPSLFLIYVFRIIMHFVDPFPNQALHSMYSKRVSETSLFCPEVR